MTSCPSTAGGHRRERGRLAVTEAMINLVLEGHGPPSHEDVARRAGVSAASLFRYFETLDELRQETIRRYFARFAHLFEIADSGKGSLDDRIDRFVATLLRLYATTEPISRLARSRAFTVPDVEDELHRTRTTTPIRSVGTSPPRLAVLSPARHDDLVAVIATTTSFESWIQLRDDHERNSAQTRRAWTTALRRLLGEFPPPPSPPPRPPRRPTENDTP